MCVDGLLEVILNPGNAGKGLEALARKCSKIQLSFLCSKHWDVGYSLEEEGPDTNKQKLVTSPRISHLACGYGNPSHSSKTKTEL